VIRENTVMLGAKRRASRIFVFWYKTETIKPWILAAFGRKDDSKFF